MITSIKEFPFFKRMFLSLLVKEAFTLNYASLFNNTSKIEEVLMALYKNKLDSLPEQLFKIYYLKAKVLFDFPF